MPKMSDDYIKNFLDAEWDDYHSNKRFLYAPHSSNISPTESPTLIIGLGGSGISAVSALKERIDQVYHPDSSVRVEYLLIDTDDIATSAHFKRSDRLVVQSADTAMLLREYQRSIDHHDSSCKEADNSHSSHVRKSSMLSDEIYGWLDPDLSPFRIMNGAAGIRQAGRLILFLNFQRVYQALAEKLEAIGVNKDAAESGIKVHIFAGTGGGTGSGMFVDISYLIRNLNENVEIQGILFMPDVSCLKPGLREVHKRNIQRNGFAALKEVEHLMMLERYHEKFQQIYPGKTVRIDSSAPLFDFCVLVGSMEYKRCPVNNEEEIYRRVAEYLLIELQPHHANSHSIESQKSNLAASTTFHHPYYDCYAAIGSTSRYLPINHYYSWWIVDIMEEIHQGLTRDISADLDNGDPEKFSKGLFRDIQNDWENKRTLVPNSLNNENTKTFRRKKIKRKATQIIGKDMQENIAAGNMEIASLEGWLDLLGKNSKNIRGKIWEPIEKIVCKSKPAWKRITFEKRRDKNLFHCYKTAFQNFYNPEFEKISKIASEFNQLFLALYNRCVNYSRLKNDTSYVFGWENFQELQKTKEYRESISSAARKIINDFIVHPLLWKGCEHAENQQPLSSHVANLLSENFKASGCLSYSTLIDIASNSGVGRKKAYYENSLLGNLNARQLWPCRPTANPETENRDFHLYKSVTIPNDPMLIAWAKEYFSRDTTVIPGEIMEQFSCAVMASGYSLHDFYELSSFEMEYLFSGNRAGLHLYPSWKNLSSPYIEEIWEAQEEEPRRQEKERDDRYRDIFRTAVDLGIIRYCDNKRLYYYCDMGKAVYIGDIPGDPSSDKYKKTAQDMFLRMFTHRDKVGKMVVYWKVFNTALDQGIIKYSNNKKLFFYDANPPIYIGNRPGKEGSSEYKHYAQDAFYRMPEIRDKVKEKSEDIAGAQQ